MTQYSGGASLATLEMNDEWLESQVILDRGTRECFLGVEIEDHSEFPPAEILSIQ